MKKFCVVLLLMASAGVGTAFAKGCDTPKGAFDQVYCSGNLFNQTDKELNTAYAELRKKLSAGDKETLKNGQLAWIAQRNEECSYEKPSGYFVNLTCANRMTEERLDFIKARLRECNSTGCAKSRLGE